MHVHPVFLLPPVALNLLHQEGMCTVYLEGLLVVSSCITNKSGGHEMEKDEEEGHVMCSQLVTLQTQAAYGAVFIQRGTR